MLPPGAGFPCKEGFVHLQHPLVDDYAVHLCLIPGTEVYRIVHDDVGTVYLDDPAIPHDLDLRPHEKGDLVETPLGLHLLYRGYEDVEEDDARGGHCVYVVRLLGHDYKQGSEDEQDEVERSR